METFNSTSFGIIHAQAMAELTKNIGDILTLAVQHKAPHQALVVHDTRSDLANALTAAYRSNIPDARFVDFDTVTPEQVHESFNRMQAGDLVVLVQTSNFRMDAFRIRVELFKRDLKVIEHVHLNRLPDLQALDYITAMAYDPVYFRGTGRALKEHIDRAQTAMIDSGGAHLHFSAPFEPAKLNVGDYSGMNNVGGQFPIGEVFTETQDFSAVHGKVRIFVFGDANFLVNKPTQPITLVVEKSRVVEIIDSTPAFDEMMAMIRRDEGEIWLREIGFGLNRAFTKDRLVNDIGTYERMCGIHLSLGAKHGVYSKPEIKRKDAKYHIDVFAVTEAVWLDDKNVYQDGAWVA